MQLSYTVCLYNHTFFTLKQIDLKQKNKGGEKLYDLNVRAICGCRQVGVGHEHLKKLCCFLNMPEPTLSKNYQHILLKLGGSAKLSQIKRCMYGAADTVDVGVSVDETWQRKGLKSLNAVIKAKSIDSGKVFNCSSIQKL